MNHFFVFDVESIGLYGPGFAVGWVIVDRNGRVLEEGMRWCEWRPLLRFGRALPIFKWLSDNIKESEWPLAQCVELPERVREVFWTAWTTARAKYSGIVMCADVPFPVEVHFLFDCTDENADREKDAPYPLIDIASVVFAAGGDPCGTESRLPDEMPAHNPLCDARQSARILIQALNKLRYVLEV